jgi:predicted rRNA methylase YqxC with S4 and FtsJ domains
MNMLEFVTVKDNILKFLQSHSEATDSDLIHKDLSFSSLPNGVAKACIEEMDEDRAITAYNEKGKDLLIISESGKKLLAAGGYTKRYIEKKKEKIYIDSINLQAIKSENNRKKQVSVMAFIVSFISLFESLLIKRI